LPDRNFAGLKDNATKVRNLFVSVRDRRDLNPEQKVKALAGKFKKAGFQYNISAASKLLWLSTRRGIICDGNALTALKNYYGYDGNKDYADFCGAWRAAYEKRRDEISKAVKRLSKLRMFMPAWHKSNKALLRLVSKKWFMERVFDIHLWELGEGG
jgi:hypothetical protein